MILRFGWPYGTEAAHSEQVLALARRHVLFSVGGPKRVAYLEPQDQGYRL